MKIIAGLGNPGAEYAATKHNVGFMLVDKLADKYGAATWREHLGALVTDIRLESEKVLLVKPQTYMNDSGRAVAALMRWYKLETPDLTVVHDDMDLPMGAVRIRRQGSDGGHRGIKSILAHLGEANFARFRLGIGHPLRQGDVINYVLTPFSPEEEKKIKEAIDYLIPAAECLVTQGVDIAMNRFNPRKQKKKKDPDPISEEATP